MAPRLSSGGWLVQKIVVGVDGSPGSAGALRWAIEEGGLRGAQVDAVNAWHLTGTGQDYYGAAGLDPSVLEAAARTVLDRAVDGADASVLKEPVNRRVVSGGAGAALLDAARGADLLVVGARGHGGFVGLLLGSVSQQVTHHATCPVVVVPTHQAA